MKIVDVSQVYGVYEKQGIAGKPVQRKPVVSKSDKLSLSKDAMDFQAVMRGLKDAPDIRAEKVADLSQKYGNGDYEPDVQRAADGLLKSGLFLK